MPPEQIDQEIRRFLAQGQQAQPPAQPPQQQAQAVVNPQGQAMQDAVQGRGQGYSDYTEATRGFRSDAPQRGLSAQGATQQPQQAPAGALGQGGRQGFSVLNALSGAAEARTMPDAPPATGSRVPEGQTPNRALVDDTPPEGTDAYYMERTMRGLRSLGPDPTRAPAADVMRAIGADGMYSPEVLQRYDSLPPEIRGRILQEMQENPFFNLERSIQEMIAPVDDRGSMRQPQPAQQTAQMATMNDALPADQGSQPPRESAGVRQQVGLPTLPGEESPRSAPNRAPLGFSAQEAMSGPTEQTFAMSDGRSFKVGKAPKKAMDQAVQSGMEFLIQRSDAIINDLLKNGDTQGAAEFRDFIRKEQTKVGMENLNRAYVAATYGDNSAFVSSLTRMVKAYEPGGPWGIDSKKTKLVVEDGRAIGAVIGLKNSSTGETNEVEIEGMDNVMSEISKWGSPDAAYQRMQQERADREREQASQSGRPRPDVSIISTFIDEQGREMGRTRDGRVVQMIDEQGNPVVRGGQQGAAQPAAAQPAPAPAQNPAQPALEMQTNPEGIPMPTMREHFDALPSGSVFIDPEGNRRIKP